MIDTALFVQISVWLTVSIMFWRSPKASIFHPVSFYLAFHGLVFVLRPLLVNYANFNEIWHYMGFYPTDEQFIKAFEVSSMGLLVFVTSCYFGAKKAKKLILPGSKIVFTKNESRAFYILLLLLLPVIIYSLKITAGGIEGEWAGETFIMTGANGYAYDSQNMVIPLLMLLLIKNRFKTFTLIPVFAFFCFRAYVGWGRWSIILSIVCFLLAYCWSQRRRGLPKFVFLVAPIIYLIFTIVGSNRDILKDFFAGHTTESAVLDKTTTWQEKYDTLDFANFDFLTYIIAVVPKLTGTYNYGIEYLQLFTEPIPRALWHSKPMGGPSFFDLNDYGNFFGLTTSLPGAGWMDGGWLGVIIISFLSGFGLGKLYSWFTWNERSKLSALVYIMAISMIVQLFRDGSIVSISKFWLFTIPPIYFWHMIVKALDSKSRQSRIGSQTLPSNNSRMRTLKIQ